MAIILGIDPGSICAGWGVIETRGAVIRSLGSGVVRMSEKDPQSKRLAKLYLELSAIIERFEPDAISLEKVFFARNADSAFKLGQSRGVVLALAGLQGIKLSEYATRHVKKILTGNGGADKDQVRFMVERFLNVKVEELDASDALALAICHAGAMDIEAKMDSAKMKLKEVEA